MKRYVIAVYVENKYGVVARVAGLFMRRGFNITSFTGQETDDPRFSRLTITLDGDEYTREQLMELLPEDLKEPEEVPLPGEESKEDPK